MVLTTAMGTGFTRLGGASCLVYHQSCWLSHKSMFLWPSIPLSGGPIRLCTWPTACGASETEQDCTGFWLVVRCPSQILLPKTCGYGAKSVDVSQGSKECAVQNSNQHSQCLLETVNCFAIMLDPEARGQCRMHVGLQVAQLPGPWLRTMSEDLSI